MANEHAATPVRYEIHKIGHDSSIITMTAAIAKSCNFLSSPCDVRWAWFPLPTHPREKRTRWAFILALEVRRPGCQSVLMCVGSPAPEAHLVEDDSGTPMVLDILTSSFPPILGL